MPVPSFAEQASVLPDRDGLLTERDTVQCGGIAVLIQILAQTKKNKQQISITGLSEHFKKIFNMVGITKFAKIYDSVEAALGQMSGGD